MRRPYEDTEDEVLSTLTQHEQLRLVGAILADIVYGGATSSDARATLMHAIDGAALSSEAFDGLTGRSTGIVH